MMSKIIKFALRPRRTWLMLKNIFQILAIFIIGAAGGIWVNQLPWFHQYQPGQNTVYITEKEEVIIQENVALVKAVEKAVPVVIAVRTQTQTGKILQGSGLIITSDGLIVTLAELVPRDSDFSFLVDNKYAQFQILKRDIENNLA